MRRRSVLLVAPDTSRSLRMGRELAPEYDTLVAATAEEALLVLSEREVDFVVSAGPGVGNSFVEAVEARAPKASHIMLTDGQSLESLIESMREGHEFTVVSGNQQTREVVVDLRQLLHPRVAERLVPATPITAQLPTTPGAPSAANC